MIKILGSFNLMTMNEYTTIPRDFVIAPKIQELILLAITLTIKCESNHVYIA
jgi:hypothetical protein